MFMFVSGLYTSVFLSVYLSGSISIRDGSLCIVQCVSLMYVVYI